MQNKKNIYRTVNMLTRKQKELYDYLSDYISSNNISPSFEEMKNALKLKSKSGIHRLVTNLEQRGFIRRLKHKARAMEITKSLSNNINSHNRGSFEIPLLGSIAAGNPIEAIEKRDMFFVSCIVVFFALTSPASSIQKPHAINITRNPAIKNNKEFKIKILCSGTSWAKAGDEWTNIKVVRVAILVNLDISASNNS